MNDVIVTKRRRSWEWRVQDQNGRVILSGRERTRPAARYQAYRTLFMLLAVGRRSTDLWAHEVFLGSGDSDSGRSGLWSSSDRPKTGQSR